MLASGAMWTINQWVARVRADGVSYYPEDGRATGGVRIWERLRPLRGVDEIVRGAVGSMKPILRDPKFGPIEELRTDDGEYAAIQAVTATGTADGKPVLYLFGFVFGDDFYNRIDGWMTEASRFGELDEVVRSAIATNHLCLGTGRHRRFFYHPPADWQGLARGALLTEWYPLDFPMHHARLSVASAFTVKEGPALVEALMARRMINFKRTGDAKRETVKFNALTGVIDYAVGEWPESKELLSTHIVTVALKDDVYTYLMRLDTTASYLDSDRHVLFNVLKSVRGVPARSGEKRAEAMAWVID
jgi:hypothetical protein